MEDEGPGSPGLATGSVFERFNRGGTQELRQGGLGPGLWMSRSIVQRHGGSISVTRSAQQRTRFTVELPVRPGE